MSGVSLDVTDFRAQLHSLHELLANTAGGFKSDSTKKGAKKQVGRTLARHLKLQHQRKASMRQWRILLSNERKQWQAKRGDLLAHAYLDWLGSLKEEVVASLLVKHHPPELLASYQ